MGGFSTSKKRPKSTDGKGGTNNSRARRLHQNPNRMKMNNTGVQEDFDDDTVIFSRENSIIPPGISTHDVRSRISRTTKPTIIPKDVDPSQSGYTSKSRTTQLSRLELDLFREKQARIKLESQIEKLKNMNTQIF